MIKGKRILLVIGVLAMCYLLSFLSKTGTSAWFVSGIEAKGNMVNAVTDDLISVSSTLVSCENGQAQVNVSIMNRYEIEIPIQLQETHHHLLPGETFSKAISTAISEGLNEIQVPLTGFNRYIDEMIEIPIDCNNDEALIDSEDTSLLETENQTNDTEEVINPEHENE
ncbi:hypothetical protein [Paucisalibacillus sp. EB02]|uniref:hypothetical protein n=1 Tax=Paucisalibacillus sp. EB02 TaxID=1347087 RepID=UPI0004B98EDA|nr:hypothetical protein [Paucisalibacillus sp. EB02]